MTCMPPCLIYEPVSMLQPRVAQPGSGYKDRLALQQVGDVCGDREGW